MNNSKNRNPKRKRGSISREILTSQPPRLRFGLFFNGLLGCDGGILVMVAKAIDSSGYYFDEWVGGLGPSEAGTTEVLQMSRAMLIGSLIIDTVSLANTGGAPVSLSVITMFLIGAISLTATGWIFADRLFTQWTQPTDPLVEYARVKHETLATAVPPEP